MNGYIERGDYMGLCESDTLREQASSEYNRKLQKGEECDFDNIYNRLLKLNGLPPIEPTKKTAESETEKEIEPIDDKQHYFWVKLHHDFFDTLIIKKLRRKPKGDTLALLYQRVILLSLKHNGYICYEGMGDDITEEISIATGESIDDCRTLIDFLVDNNQATLSDDKTYIYIHGYEDCTGADKPKTRMKHSRIRKKQQEQNNQLS